MTDETKEAADIMSPAMSMHDCIRAQLDHPEIVFKGLVHGLLQEIRLTPEQGHAVLDGGELVVIDGKAVVK